MNTESIKKLQNKMHREVQNLNITSTVIEGNGKRVTRKMANPSISQAPVTSKRSKRAIKRAKKPVDELEIDNDQKSDKSDHVDLNDPQVTENFSRSQIIGKIQSTTDY